MSDRDMKFTTDKESSLGSSRDSAGSSDTSRDSVSSGGGGACDIAALMKQYGNDVLRTAYSYVKDRDTAEDLFQQVFIKAYYNYDKFRGESSVKTWLIRITVNVAKDFLKSAYQRHVTNFTEYEEETLAAEDQYEKVDDADRDAQIRKAVMELPDNYREAVDCVYFREMSVTEAARALGVAEGTVKSRLFRARDILKTKLEGRL